LAETLGSEKKKTPKQTEVFGRQKGKTPQQVRGHGVHKKKSWLGKRTTIPSAFRSG